MESFDDRLISLGEGTAAIPERLLIAHARGEVLFIAGAGVSQPAGLPDFRGLVLDVYKKIDQSVYQVISKIPRNSCNQWDVNHSSLTNQQSAEVRRFISGDYDVVLGMLERRIDGKSTGNSSVRLTVAKQLRNTASKPVSIHKTLMKLADRGGAVTIVTTNFDLLLEAARSKKHPKLQSYSLGGIPRPGRSDEFSGVLHIHGALDRNPSRVSDLILSDQDFGEFYLRRRVVPDFIYDAARLFNIVLVGYSANDPPMRYLLNAVAADGTRFDDLKERFTFMGSDNPDPIAIEDWKGRGITPINYDSINQHLILRHTLERWAQLFNNNGSNRYVYAEIKRIVKSKRAVATESSRDLFDHLIRRSNPHERISLTALASKHGADLDWLDAITEINNEKTKGYGS